MQAYKLFFVKGNTAYFYIGNISDIDQTNWKKGLNWKKVSSALQASAPTLLPTGQVKSLVFSTPHPIHLSEAHSVPDLNSGLYPWMTIIKEEELIRFYSGITMEKFREQMLYCEGEAGEEKGEGHSLKYWLYSDPHFNHENIIGYSERPFADIEEMNQTLIRNYNEKVSPGDKVYFLGDVGMGNVRDIIEQLNGYKMLIMGNHDDVHSRAYWLDAGFDEVYKHSIIVRGEIILSHRPMLMSEDMPYFNIHGHIHTEPSPSSKHLNVSVERTGYYPVKLDRYKKIKKAESERA